jgi:hypothetical protein
MFFFTYNRAYDHIDICNVSMWGSSIAVQIDGSGHRLRNSDFVMCGGQGILGGGDDMIVDQNRFLNCGDQATDPDMTSRQHALYVCSSYPIFIHNMRVTNNYIHFDPNGTIQPVPEPWRGTVPYGACAGIVLAWRCATMDGVIENNYIEGYGAYSCQPIAVTASDEQAWHYRTVVRRNRIKWHQDNPGTMVRIDFCQNCKIEDNLLESDVATDGIMVPTETAAHKGGGLPTSGAVVRNNSVRIPGGRPAKGGKGLGIGVGTPYFGSTEGRDYVVENNVVWTDSRNVCQALGTGYPAAKGHPFTMTTYPRAESNTAGNYCVNNGASASVIFADPMNGDYRPRNPGPLIGTANQSHYSPIAMGTVSWDPTDPGSARSPPIDIGAYQR